MRHLCQEKSPFSLGTGFLVGVIRESGGELIVLAYLKKDRTLAAIWLLVILNFRFILQKVVNFNDVNIVATC
jgi:hypothetical protein